ncbi:hypothetical protein QLL95_gp0952 [Cotonvirus japonicus]|uniref:Uncharacterized protein n=1 Tax=Cotonvirus japonicus TaxID=2811091 RepID=A0ABM7NST6_9VIRU|nr:hypothetical protein QLL95_gp0952 [Cotonvirus japonicus]BCS83171.1 hypothetical protein [Cotonvirus japonicus]
MSELKTNVTSTEILGITTPYIIDILKTIKKIQLRMKDPDLISMDYISVYDTLGKEFSVFSDKYTKIFTDVVQKKNLNTTASVLYYKDKVERGLMSEEELQNMLAEKFLPKHLKEESDAKILEMKKTGEI